MEIPLSKLKAGESGIVRYFEGGMEFQRKMASLGIAAGKKVKVLSAQPLMGPIVVRVDNTRVAIGRGMANKIIIEK